MIEFTSFCLFLMGMISCAQGQRFTILTKFLNGKLIFTWSNISTFRNDIVITKDSHSTPWIQVYDDQYTVEDVLQYKSVSIIIREYYMHSSEFGRDFVNYNKTYNVNTVESKEGESRNISWTVDHFPSIGRYYIFHEYIGPPSEIITVAETYSSKSKKYAYHTRPYNSTDIWFEVRNITMEDAGYYAGGVTKTDALSGRREGVVLIVYGKPLKPIIIGDLNIKVRNYTYLQCESSSTSGPNYYKQFPPLSYSWFINNTRIDGVTRKTYSFIVSKDVKYNRYSCQAKETLESERSEEIRINPLYLLDPKVFINDKHQNALTVNELSPLFLSCFVEGNPAPEVTLRKLTGNQIIKQSVENWLNYTLIRESQCSDTSTYSCEGKSTEFGSKNQLFNINVLCDPRLDESTLFETNYSSMSGPDVKVVVSLPIVANPSPSISGIAWSGPTSQYISTEVSQRDNIIYKHWINSSIPIPDKKSFRNYSLKFNGRIIVDITIKTPQAGYFQTKMIRTDHFDEE